MQHHALDEVAITLRDFETGVVQNAHFHHLDNVRVGYELIARDRFDIAIRFAGGC